MRLRAPLMAWPWRDQSRRQTRQFATWLIRGVITSVDNPRVKDVLRLRKCGSGGGLGCSSPRGRARSSARGRPGSRCARPTSRPRSCRLADGGEEVSERVLAQDGLPRRARRRARGRRDPAARAPRRRHAAPRRGRDREAGQPRRDGAHRRRRRGRRAARRRRERRPVEPERDPRVDRRRVHPADRRGDARRGRRAAAPEGRRRARRADRVTPTPTTPRPTAFLVGAEDEGLDDDWRAIADIAVEIPMQRSGGGLAERECRRRGAALRGGAPAQRAAASAGPSASRCRRRARHPS